MSDEVIEEPTEPVVPTEPVEPTEPEEPTITLIVEDGTCVPKANSYISLEDAQEYQLSCNRADWIALTDEEKKASLIKATVYVDNLFKWKGRRKFQEQELSFPRVMIKDLDGFDVVGIPKRLKQAICEAAYYGYQGELFSVYENDTGNLKRSKNVVEGAVEQELEYFDKSESQVDFISKYAALDSLLRGLYIPKNQSKFITAKANWSY